MLHIRERTVSHDSCLMSRFIHGQLAYSNTLGQLIITPNFSEVGISENLGKTLQIHWLKTSLDVNAHFPIISPWKWPEIGFSETLRWTPPNPMSKVVNLIFQWVSHKFPMGFPIQSAVLFCNQDAMAARVRSTAPWATSRCLRSAVKETLGFNGSKLKQRKLGFNYLAVSWNRATPKSSVFFGFSILNHPFGGTPIYGNPYFNVGKTERLGT